MENKGQEEVRLDMAEGSTSAKAQIRAVHGPVEKQLGSQTVQKQVDKRSF